VPTQHHIQWVTRAFFPCGLSGWYVKLTTHLHLVPKLRIRGAIPPFPHVSSWRGAHFSTGYVFVAWYLVKHRDNFAFTLPSTHSIINSFSSGTCGPSVYPITFLTSSIISSVQTSNNPSVHPSIYLSTLLSIHHSFNQPIQTYFQNNELSEECKLTVKSMLLPCAAIMFSCL
jgi:hypothetical protein